MLKSCVVLNGVVINIGEWDYLYEDSDGEQVVRNPMPEGATIEERDFDYQPDRGWYEVGTPAPKTPAERIAELEVTNALMQAALDDLILNGGGGI